MNLTIRKHGVLIYIQTCKYTLLFQFKNDLKPINLLSSISAVLHGMMVKYRES